MPSVAGCRNRRIATESDCLPGSYGGADPVLQFSVAVPYDRCEAFRLRFTDLNQQGSGQSFSLTEVKLHVGLESGRPSLPTRKKR